MPRKKTETSSPLALEAKETITLSVEVSRSLYEQVLASAKVWGLESGDGWLLEAVVEGV